jgi:hypothetical protein
LHPPLGWLSYLRSEIGPTYGTRFPQLGPDVSDASCSTAGSEVAGQHAYKGGEVNRGIIGVIIGVLVIIILVIVILQLT